MQHLTANMWSWLVTAVVILGSLKSPLVVDACSMPAGWRPPTTQEVLDDYNEVLFGRVRRTFRDPDRPWAQNLYTAEVRVYCIMKGERTSSILNITDVGLFLADVFITCRFYRTAWNAVAV